MESHEVTAVRAGHPSGRTFRSLPEIYLAFSLLLTTLLCFLTPPFFAPDESHHAARAISIGHGAWLAHMGTDEAGAEIDSDALKAMDGMDQIRMEWEKHAGFFLDRSYGAVSAAQQREFAAIPWSRATTFAPFANTALYPPLLYLPAVAGWRLAEAADLTIFHSLQIARLFSAWTSVLIAWGALRLCSGSRWILLAYLLLPSTLFLDASCSQDALLLSLAALLVALLARVLAAGRGWSSGELAGMTALLTLCATARPPYAVLALLLFLPNAEVRERCWRRWIAPAAGFAVVFASCAAWRWFVLPFGFDEADQADPALQQAFLHAHPLAAAGSILRGTGEAAVDFVQRGLYVVGWNDLLPHHGAAAVLAVCLSAVVLCAPLPASPVRTWLGRGLLLAAIAGPLLGISLAEYIIWTPPGGPTVFGIQPRYWLPVCPLAMLLLQACVRVPLRRRYPAFARGELPAQRGVGMTALVVLVSVACTLPWMVSHAFYREGVLQVLRLNLP